MNEKEYILCAAIWYKDLPAEFQTVSNIDRGMVVTGHRHPDIMAVVKMLSGKRTVTSAEDGVGEYTQGFLTSKDRFVDRQEAAKIAFLRNQITLQTNSLYSEDLY